MKLTDTAIKKLKPQPKVYRKTDGRGLILEVKPTGTKTWIYRYTLNGKRHAPMKIGDYPGMGLADARTKRQEMENLVKSGKNPKEQIKQDQDKNVSFVQFTNEYYEKVVKKDRKTPSGIRRYLDRDILPTLKDKLLSEITVEDVSKIIDLKKALGSDAVALELRNLIKRIFDYAIAHQKVAFNPASALPSRYIFKPKSRDRSLTSAEIKAYLGGVYSSNISRQNKLALHLILLCLTRRTETVLANWKNVDLETGKWMIPAQDSKTDAHIIYLSNQAIEIFEELKYLSNGSDWAFPAISDYRKHIHESTLNHALSGIHFDIPRFTIHDSRRTASTLLHEARFNSDVIEKALNHRIAGIRGVYNKAAYADQRKEMLQFWGNYIDNLLNDSNVILGRFGQ
jgi:integrase